MAPRLTDDSIRHTLHPDPAAETPPIDMNSTGGYCLAPRHAELCSLIAIRINYKVTYCQHHEEIGRLKIVMIKFIRQMRAAEYKIYIQKKKNKMP